MRSRPRRPPPVTRPVPENSDEQADVRAVRARPLKMDTSCLRDICRPILPNDRSWARQPKQSLVEMLNQHHNRLTSVFMSVAADTPGTLHAQAAMSPQAARPPPLAAASPPPQPSPSQAILLVVQPETLRLRFSSACRVEQEKL